MTGRERMLQTLQFIQPDRPPHFEVMFELEQEAFGLQFPKAQDWLDCSGSQKNALISTCMEIYARLVERYHWDALIVYYPWGDPDGISAAKEAFGKSLLIGGILSATTWAIDTIDDWTAFSIDLIEHPERLHEEAERKTQRAFEYIDRMADAGADFIYIANDVAFNGGPFISPPQFSELVAPYLGRQVQRVKDRGALAFVHSDGQLMPILDQILDVEPNVLQSIDPMAGMDIAEVKRRARGRTALMGNVQCSLLQDGPREKIRQSALYALENAAEGGGYIFSTSNSIFPGLPLENYEYMLCVFEDYCKNKTSSND